MFRFLLALKTRITMTGIFPNKRKTGHTWPEDLLAQGIQPVADDLGLPHITWRLLRHQLGC